LVDNFLTFDAGRRSWLGFDDGTLEKPAALQDPANLEAIQSPAVATLASRDDEVAAVLDETTRSLNTQKAPTLRSTPLNYSFSADIGNQFLVGGKPLGVQVGINYSRNFSFYDDGLNNNYILGGGQASQLIENFQLTETRATETPQLSGLAAIGFKFSPNNEIKFISLYSHSTEISSLFLEGIYADYDIIEDERFQSRTLSFQERQLADFILSGEHLLRESGIRINWAGSYVNTQQIEPDLRFFANDFDTADSTYAISAPGNYSFPGHFFRDLIDEEYLGKLDVTIPFLKSKNTGNKLKFGGYYRTKNRTFNENIFNLFRRQGEVYQGDPGAFFGEDNIGVLDKTDSGRNTIGLFVVDQSLPSNSYTGEQEIWASYGMLTVNLLADLKLIAGGCVEGTYFYVESAAAEFDPEGEVAEIDEVDFLPAAHLIYNLNDNTNLRLSYSNTLARPNMREIAPFGSFGFIGDPIVFGNPDLVRTRIDNFDIRYELYPEGRRGELFTVSAFYKAFDEPIVRTFRPAGNPQFTWKNVPNATLYGGEIEIRKALDVISPALSDFQLSANFAYIFSTSDIDSTELVIIRDVNPDASDTRPFAGQSEFVANANLVYSNDENGWDAAISYNYFSDRLSETGIQGTPDVFELGRSTLDFSLSKQIGKMSITFRARNLINPFFQRFNTYLDQDYIYSRFRRGRVFSFGISYGI
jgi:TonB-dependent receptor